jgi:hypothetical protein
MNNIPPQGWFLLIVAVVAALAYALLTKPGKPFEDDD